MMLRRFRSALGLGFLASVFPVWALPASAQTIVVPTGAAWLYDATGTDLGTGWEQPAYPDGGWASGTAILGFGETYITTVIPYGGDPNDKNPTTYFRHEFTFTGSPGSVTYLQLRLNYDDGVIVYLNGVEVARRSLTAGTVTYATYASSHEGGSLETVDITAFAGNLVTGTNVLAAEVHQRDPASSDLVWDAELSYATTAVVVTRGPYLQRGTDTAQVVRWRTSAPTSSRVVYGLDPGLLNQSVSDAAVVTEHELTVTGLDPETTYYYGVGTTDTILDGGDAGTAFTTAPVPGTIRPVRAWLIGDSGTGDSNAFAVRNGYTTYAGSRVADLWVMLGDNAYNTGTDSEYQSAVFETYPDQLRRINLWPTRGNHDGVYAGVNNDYYDIFTLPDSAQAGGLVSGTEAYYSFDHADVHFICLDSEGSDRSVGGAMHDWVVDDLNATQRSWVVAYWHHPPYTKGSHNSDNASDSGGRMRDMRENFLPDLEAGGVDLVLCGHSHSYERSFLIDGHYLTSDMFLPGHLVDGGDGDPLGDGAYEKPTYGPAPHEGSVYVVAGSSGKISGGALNHPVMVTSLNLLGSVVLDVNGGQLDAVFLNVNGGIEDSFSIIKGTAGALPDAGVTPGAAFPNPFARSAVIPYAIEHTGRVLLTILDVSGRRVRTVTDETRAAGDHRDRWDGRDDTGVELPSGVYFSVLETGGDREVRRLVLVR